MMTCRLLLTEIIQIFFFVFFILDTNCAPFNWSLVEVNVTGNISLPELFQGHDNVSDGVDYEYHNMYDDYDTSASVEPTNEDDDDTHVEETKYVPPPGLGPLGREAAFRDPHMEPPDYMLDLYNRFSGNQQYIHPTSNIVRSFMNINQDEFNTTYSGQQSGNHTRVHKLVFNITSISEDEDIDYAMLRLYTLVQQDRDAYAGVDRIVSVLRDRGKGPEDSEDRYEILSCRHVFGHNSGWEAFDVTSAVKRWASNITCVQILEVRIESVFNVVTEGDMDIDTDPKHRNEPLLVIFSNNMAKQRLREKELHEMISHELDSVDGSNKVQQVVSESRVPHKHLTSMDSHARVRRSKKNRRNSCRRRPMYVSFQEINWHLWIIAPQGYQAFECVGKCYIPLSDHLTPTKHAVIQTLFHGTRSKDVSRACCVPTKLNPISILYVDENDIITYKYKYEGMQVAQCGCR